MVAGRNVTNLEIGRRIGMWKPSGYPLIAWQSSCNKKVLKSVISLAKKVVFLACKRVLEVGICVLFPELSRLRPLHR